VDQKAVQIPFNGSGWVHIGFPAKACPSRVVFELKETEPEMWLNSGTKNFVVQLKPPDLSDLVDEHNTVPYIQSLGMQMDEKAVQTPFDGSGRVHISFSAKACPSRVVFVLKETEPEKWLNSGAGDFVAQLKAPDLSDLVDKVITAESIYTHWSLFNRFCMANDILDAADAAGKLYGGRFHALPL